MANIASTFTNCLASCIIVPVWSVLTQSGKKYEFGDFLTDLELGEGGGQRRYLYSELVGS